jgi:predicted nucleic acid-binding protein
MKVLLDTNAYSAWKRNDETVLEIIHRSEHLFLSAVVAGELLFGFRIGSRFRKNYRELLAFLESPFVTFLPVTFDSADRFSLIASSLRRKGRPLPTNDIWIAAHAMESGAYLISFDTHFEQIDGLAWLHPAL